MSRVAIFSLYEFPLKAFGIEKYAKDKAQKREQWSITSRWWAKREVNEEGYKFLDILQLDQMLNTKMKENISPEYARRIKKLCKSKLKGRNLVRSIKLRLYMWYMSRNHGINKISTCQHE